MDLLFINLCITYLGMKQIIEEIAFRNGYRLQDIFKDISLILFQICFRHNNGQVLVFCNDKKLFKLYFILGNVHCMYCHATLPRNNLLCPLYWGA